jgi:hypothetical protein
MRKHFPQIAAYLATKIENGFFDLEHYYDAVDLFQETILRKKNTEYEVQVLGGPVIAKFKVISGLLPFISRNKFRQYVFLSISGIQSVK